MKRESQKMLEQERDKDREKRQLARNKAREQDRRGQESHDRERLRFGDREADTEQDPVVMPKQSFADLKPMIPGYGGDLPQHYFDKTDGPNKAHLKILEAVKNADNGYLKEKAGKGRIRVTNIADKKLWMKTKTTFDSKRVGIVNDVRRENLEWFLMTIQVLISGCLGNPVLIVLLQTAGVTALMIQ